jgi:phenylalanyl-tRNA synthetase beta subunit
MLTLLHYTHTLCRHVRTHVQVPPAASYAASSLSKSVTSAEGGPWREGYEYFIQAAKNPTFFPGRCADVMLRRTGVAGGEGSGEMTRLGSFGILHPEVLHAFDIGDYPASALEVDLEPLM